MNGRHLKMVVAACVVLSPPVASADQLCDSAFQDCRAPLIQLIRSESVGIDVAFWFMEDTRYASELINRWRAGVPVRVVMDTRAVTQYGYAGAGTALQMMKDAGIPMRTKSSGGILHFKTMVFAGQHVVEFSGANYSPEAFVPPTPYVDYVDEIIYFSNNPAIVNSFMTRFDDIWMDTSSFSSYANVPGALVRRYPQYPIAPELNFVPWQNFRSRSVARYRQETQRIDSIMYRITDRAHSDEMIAAVQRGVTVRLVVEPYEYRSRARLWNSWNIDRMHAAGIQVRQRKHAGLLHEKLTILNGTGMTIFGSSNWTSASAGSQHEHNLFTTDPAFFNWARDHFERKWTNRTGHLETEPFVPLPPDTPSLVAPADGAGSQPTSVTLTWHAGPWAHKYDVFIGTSASSLTKVLEDRELGPSVGSTGYIKWTVSGLAGGTTYYWKVVSRTMANMERSSAVRSFHTTGSGGGTGGSSPTTLTVTSISSSVPSPQAPGRSITFTARSAGGTAPQFKWLVYDGSTWSVLREWGAATVTWTPAQANSRYRIGVWARSEGSAAGEAAASIPFAITGASAQGQLTITAIRPSVSSPRPVNTSITFTATTSGGYATPEFTWLLYDGATWSVLRGWGSGTYTWTPTRANANYRIGVWARNAGQQAGEAAASVPFVITAPLVVSSITANTATIRAGRSVTFTATAIGGTSPYQFTWVVFDGTRWSTLRSWGDGSISWTPPRAGSYRMGVWARSAGLDPVAASVPVTVLP